jgi:hypothetical protein
MVSMAVSFGDSSHSSIVNVFTALQTPHYLLSQALQSHVYTMLTISLFTLLDIDLPAPGRA